MSRPRIIAAVISYICLLGLAGSAVKKGIDFQQPWRLLVTIITLAILSALMIENFRPDDKSKD